MNAISSAAAADAVEEEGLGASPASRCIVPLLDALGWKGDDTHLSEALPHFAEQMGLTELLNTMASLKFQSTQGRARLAEIDPRELPCLFVPDGAETMWVLNGMVGGKFLAYDGAQGAYVQVDPDWTRGTTVYFSAMRRGAASLLRPQQNWSKSLFWRFKGLFAQAIGLSLILAMLAMLSPMMVMLVYDTVIASRSFGTLASVALGMLIFVVAEAGFRMLRAYLLQYVSARLGFIMGNEVLRRLLYLPPNLTEVSNLGAQVSRIRDFENIREFFVGPAAVALFEVPFILLLVIALVIIAGPLAYLPALGICAFLAFGLFIRGIIQRVSAGGAGATSERQAFVVETLSNLRALKAASATGLWARRFRTISAEAATSASQVAALNAMVSAVSHGIIMFTAVGTMAVGVGLVMDNALTVGGLMASMALLWRILSPLGTGFGVMTQVGRIGKSIDQVDRLMSMRLESEDAAIGISPTFQGKVEFSNVSIRYSPEAPPALVGVNFTARPGEMTALIGHDGAGKTTALKLIMGLYQPQAGRILIDDTNLRQLDPVVLRRHVSYLPKSLHFFHGTLAQNLVLANPTATEADLREACRAAGVLDAVDAMPRGLDTRIGDHNIQQLPMGLRRRLALARVFLRRSRLVLLDEPETGLSGEDEEDIVRRVSNLREFATVIVVTDSDKLLDACSGVVWLENGRLRKWGRSPDVVSAYRNHWR